MVKIYSMIPMMRCYSRILHNLLRTAETCKGLTGLVAPCVNSYKQLVPGYEAPVYIGWAQTNRSALIRIPTSGRKANGVRVELRCPDPSCNPYLAIAAMLACGLDGISKICLWKLQ